MKKRFFGIPVVVVVLVLALVLATGGVFAWYQVTTGTATVTVDEAITIANTTGDDGDFVGYDPSVWTVSLLPGEVKALFIEVTNASSAALDVIATYTISPAGLGLTVTGNAGIKLDVPVTVAGNSSGVFAIEVHAAGDVSPGTYTVNFALNRK